MKEREWTDEERELLEQLLTGDRAETEPDVAERLQRNPELAAEVASMRAFESRMRAASSARDEALAAAAAAVDQGDQRSARRAVDQHLRRLRIRRRLRPLMLAAVLLAAVLLAVWQWPQADTGSDPRLGRSPAAEALGMEPHGVLERGAFTGLHWRTPAPGGGYYRLAIYPASGNEPSSLTPLFPVEDVFELEWIPSPMQRDTLFGLDGFCWELTPSTGGGRRGVPVRAFVQLSR